MSVDRLHQELASALQSTAKELTDVLDLAEQTVRQVEKVLYLPYHPGDQRISTAQASMTLVREWHVGSRHTTGIARRAGVMETYRQAAAERQGTL